MDYNDYVNKTYEAHKNGNYAEAIRLCTLVIETYPKAGEGYDINRFAGIYNNRGLFYAKLKEYDKAIADFDKVIEINSDYANTYFYRGLVYTILKEYSKSSKDYSKMFDLLKKQSELEEHYKSKEAEARISIFKFSPLHENALKTLINQKMFLAQPHKHWNDPHDCNIGAWAKNTQNLFREKARLQSFSIEKASKKPYQNTLLWSHYADSHKGICVEYEYTFKDKPIATLHEVKYQSEIKFNELGDGFRIKVEDWEYENEVRLFHYDETNKEETPVLKSFEELGLKIKAVYFGERCTDDNQATIKKILVNNKNIVFKKMKTEERSFILHEEEIKCQTI
jgi:tetratricopeptide (TPR) repeat protein